MFPALFHSYFSPSCSRKVQWRSLHWIKVQLDRSRNNCDSTDSYHGPVPCLWGKETDLGSNPCNSKILRKNNSFCNYTYPRSLLVFYMNRRTHTLNCVHPDWRDCEVHSCVWMRRSSVKNLQVCLSDLAATDARTLLGWTENLHTNLRFSRLRPFILIALE